MQCLWRLTLSFTFTHLYDKREWTTQMWSPRSNVLNLSTADNYKFLFYVLYLAVFCCAVPCKANFIYPGMDEAPIVTPEHYHHPPFKFRCSHSWSSLYAHWKPGELQGTFLHPPFPAQKCSSYSLDWGDRAVPGILLSTPSPAVGLL